jgi:hypothetical protein
MTTFYDFSGGMESAAMLVTDLVRIRAAKAVVRWANTGKQFPEMAASIAQIETILNLRIVEVPQRITFEEFLFERGGMLRKGINDCSRRMKRSNLMAHVRTFPRPWEINLGFNSAETERAESFTDLNERPHCHWRFPLIEAGISRERTWDICRDAGFSILVEMYEKMGRFDCYFCPNQKPSQALRVAEHYPELAKEWTELETRKGHSFMSLPLSVMVAESKRQGRLFESSIACACFGGSEDVWDDDVSDSRREVKS